jgi:hypothetical protein
MLNAGLRTKPHVCRGEGQTDYKRALAYYLLGISPKDFQRIPYFGAQLRRIARIANVADGNIPSIPALALLAASEDPIAGKVRHAYSLVPESYRRLLPPEAFCHVAGVSPWAVLDAITVAAVKRGAMASCAWLASSAMGCATIPFAVFD